MKILYSGAIYPGYVSTTLMRMNILRDLGHEVHGFCQVPSLGWGGRYGGVLFRRSLSGPPLYLVNRALRREAARFEPDLVWIDKGVWITAETLTQLKARHQSLLVHYTPDPAFATHHSRHFFKAIPVYDLLITNKKYEIDQYRRHGAKDLLFKYAAFDRDFHQPVSLSLGDERRYGCDTVFIGTYAKGRERYLSPLTDAAIDLAIWGANWSESCSDASLLKNFRGSTLSGRDYTKGIAGGRIGLGLLSPLHPDRSTTRSVEIPACGKFLLAERTEEHQELFEEGHEAEFFSEEAELVDKVHYYLDHDHERDRIAAAGRERCLNSGYSYQHQLKEILETLSRRAR